MSQLYLKFKDYLNSQKIHGNAPLTMESLLRPFGLNFRGGRDQYLLLGHVLDELCEEFSAEDDVDPIDVSAVALSLGYTDAERFIEESPWIMVQMAQELGKTLRNKLAMRSSQGLLAI